MTRQFLACSNCDQGAASRYWWLTAGVVLVSLVLVVVLLARLRAGDVKTRVPGAVAAVVLLVGLGLSLNTLAHGTQAVAVGVKVSCGSALTAAKTRGSPTDAALDPTQLACREAGRRHLRDGLPVALPIFAIGLVSTIVGMAAAGRRQAATRIAA